MSLFCQELTGIQQADVENAQQLNSVINDLILWLQKEDLIDNKLERKAQFAFASCGNFDLNLLTPLIRANRFNNNNLEVPIYFKEWINVKKTFVNHKKEWPKGLYNMMELLGNEPYGRLHSARDDCLNLAKVIECLHQDGAEFHITNRLQ